MHRVKGLEFDDVIIASVNDGIVPLPLSSIVDSSSELAEESENLERALLYVSATRAKKKVLMTSYGKKSGFLTSIDLGDAA
jgi:superfamily I DNA/RNA helicase